MREECDLKSRAVCESTVSGLADRCEECDLSDRKPRISLEEKQSRMFFLNPRRLKVHRVRVDGCAIIDGPRCDWLLVTPDTVEHYVELKGSDVKRALEQIEESMKKLSSNVKSSCKRAFVISRKNPLTNTEVQNRKTSFRKHYNTALRMERPNFEFEI